MLFSKSQFIFQYFLALHELTFLGFDSKRLLPLRVSTKLPDFQLRVISMCSWQRKATEIAKGQYQLLGKVFFIATMTSHWLAAKKGDAETRKIGCFLTLSSDHVDSFPDPFSIHFKVLLQFFYLYTTKILIVTTFNCVKQCIIAQGNIF